MSLDVTSRAGLGAKDGDLVEVAAGDCVFIPPGVAHWYENRTDRIVRFLCVVPRTDDYRTEWLEAPESSE
mgnify:CR=1 FL=1